MLPAAVAAAGAGAPSARWCRRWLRRTAMLSRWVGPACLPEQLLALGHAPLLPHTPLRHPRCAATQHTTTHHNNTTPHHTTPHHTTPHHTTPHHTTPHHTTQAALDLELQQEWQEAEERLQVRTERTQHLAPRTASACLSVTRCCV
jgi:hypothetical protein